MFRYLVLLSGLLFASAASAQVVQLPSLNTFSVQTSVLVPDSGNAYLGGTNRSSHWMASRGPGWGPLGRNRGRAGGASSSGMSITATIIDNAELDALVLEEARAIRAEKGIVLADETHSRIAVPRDSPATSVAAIKRELAAADATQEAEAEQDLKRAIAYERAGEGALARNYYRVAARKSTGVTKQQAIDRLTAIASKSISPTR